MDNDEIKALLRELKERSDAEDQVKGKTVKISFGEEEPPAREKSRRRRSLFKKAAEASGEDDSAEENAEKNTEENAEENAEEDIRKPKTRKQTSAAKQAGRSRPDPAAEEKPEKKKGRKLFSVQKEKDADGFGEENGFFEDEEDFRETDELLQEARRNGGSSRGPWKNLQLAVKDYFDDLKSRGIGGKELIMLAAGAVLVIFLIFAIGSALFGEDKSVNVTAEDGLYVTVEKEPEAWCSRGTVELGIRTGKQIQSITINGNAVEFEAGRGTRVTLEADTGTLELMVVTEERVLNAQVDIPMIDGEQPLISVKQENGQVTMNAVDERSGVEGIYYGVLEGFSDVPLYQKYTGPFVYEPGKIYYYYAQDYAGNRTVPTATNMEPAQSLVLSESSVTLFPGDSFSLNVSSSPNRSYCNNLKLTNSAPSVVSLGADGTVTALQEGDAVIEATADGLSPVSCQIMVRSETEITISTVGDCTLGSDANFSTLNSFDTYWSMYGDSYFFQNVRSILQEDDITFANLEGTLTTADTREVKEFAFRGSPEYTDILKDGSIEVVTLANNHSSDYGAQSLTDTKQYLTEAGIDYCTGDEIAFKEVKGVKIALIGIYVLEDGLARTAQVEQTIASAQEQGADLIVVAFHWGTEKSTQPDEIQQSLAHTAIDSGADLVVGHHPHVLQGIEQYQGKNIVYSLGNFCFGGNSNPSDTDSMIFQQTFSVTKGGEITGSRIKIIPCSITSQYGGNNYQPTPAEGSEADRIMDRINEYSAQFGQTYELLSR